MRALICGGGVGGLAAAVALKRAGHDVVVFEQSEEMRITGAGLNLWPNAVSSLYELGMKESFDSISAALDYYISMDSSGEVLHKQDVRNWETKYGGPAAGVHRRALTEMLADHAGIENIKLGHKLTGFEDDGTQIICQFSNGETYEGDFLIGADGIHSQVRQTMLGNFDYHENTKRAYRWRGIVPLADIDIKPHSEIEVIEGDSFFGIIPIGNGKAYWYASGPELNNRELFDENFSSWTKTHVPKTISATSNDTILQTKLVDLADLPKQWTKERVALLGDAAHPMMPDMAQGASQTFVDARALSQSLHGATRKTVSKQLKEYENHRRETAEHVVNLSRGIISLKRDFAGHTLDPIVVKYEREIEGFKISD